MDEGGCRGQDDPKRGAEHAAPAAGAALDHRASAQDSERQQGAPSAPLAGADAPSAATPEGGYPPAARMMPRTSWRGGIVTRSVRAIPEETPIAFTYNRATHAVMLATPSDLEDFAVGLSLSEGIIDRPADIGALEVVALPRGIELRMDLRPDRMDALTRRHRHMAGASGCGLCGIESLDEAIRPVPRVESDARVPPSAILAAMASMHPEQALNDQTHGVHAAAFWTETRGMVALREDVGRHNALDKLIGALALRHVPTAHGILLLTSRVSVEMVQKAATLGVPVLAAISVPTALAVQVAEQAGITLIAIARADGFEVFTHSHRITTEPVQHVA